MGNKWRDASAELPADCQHVLVVALYDPEANWHGMIAQSTAMYTSNGKWMVFGIGLGKKAKVLYWMPLPELPIELIIAALEKSEEGEMLNDD